MHLKTFGFQLTRNGYPGVTLWAQIIEINSVTACMYHRVHSLMKEIYTATSREALTTPEQWRHEITRLSGCEWHNLPDGTNVRAGEEYACLNIQDKAITFTHRAQLDMAIKAVQRNDKKPAIDIDEVLGFVLE